MIITFLITNRVNIVVIAISSGLVIVLAIATALAIFLLHVSPVANGIVMFVVIVTNYM